MRTKAELEEIRRRYRKTFETNNFEEAEEIHKMGGDDPEVQEIIEEELDRGFNDVSKDMEASSGRTLAGTLVDAMPERIKGKS